MLKVGVVGATGYAGEEVIKILVNHKLVKVAELSAVIDKEEPISSIFPGPTKRWNKAGKQAARGCNYGL